jgi:hypothetical protein
MELALMKKLIILLFTLLFLSACSNEETKQQEKAPELIEVSITTPEKIKVQEEATIEASVVQGKEKVTDADEVKFEIWKAGQDNHEMVEAKHQKDGIYSIKKTFTEGGNYYIVAHTTARRMHSMPKKEITVEAMEAEKQAEGMEHSHDDHPAEGSEDEHGDHHNSEVDFDFHVHEPIKSNQKADLTVHLNQGSEQITGASVRLEIWGENQSKHEFIPAVEGANGAYSLTYTFPSSGTFNVKIHVEKGNIHDHTEKTVNVN